MKKKKSPRKMLITSFISCLVVGVLVAGGVSARVDQKFLDAWDVVKSEVESLLSSEPDNKSENIPSVSELQNNEVLGGAGETASSRNVTGLFDLTLKDSDSSEDDIKWVRRQISDTIGTASSTFISVQNTTGHDIYVESALIRLFTNASATVRLGMGTSSVTGSAYNLAWGSVPKQIFGALVATSTGDGLGMATSTNGSAFASISTDGRTTTTAQNPWVVVKPKEYIIGLMQTTDSAWAVTTTAGRGFSASSFYLLNILEMSTST